MIKRLKRLLRHDHELDDLQEFQLLLGATLPKQPLSRPLLMEDRLTLIREELEELEDAVKRRHLPDQADALVDLIYVAKGTALLLGLPWEALWADVHRANMLKRPAKTARVQQDAVKPAGWVPPQTVEILVAAGWAKWEQP